MATATTAITPGPTSLEPLMIAAYLALLVYDYFLTLDAEVERFWKKRPNRRLSFGTFIFFVNRYLALLGYIPIVLELLSQNGTVRMRCKYILDLYCAILGLVLQIIIVCMMMLRVCALYGYQQKVLLSIPTMFAICSIVMGVIGVSFSPLSNAAESRFRCDNGFGVDHASYVAGAFGGELAFDVTIFAMTLYKTLRTPRENGLGLLTVIMRDGIMYFGIMSLFNLANILLLVLADVFCSITFMNIISSIMMTRLMLNLRDPSLTGCSEETKPTTIRFDGGMSSEATDEASMSIISDERSV